MQPFLATDLTELCLLLNNINLNKVAVNNHALEILPDLKHSLNSIKIPENCEYKLYIEQIKKLINKILAEIKGAQPGFWSRMFRCAEPAPVTTSAQQENLQTMSEPAEVVRIKLDTPR